MVEAGDLLSNVGNQFGFAGWNLNLGFFGNLVLWLVLSVFIVGIAGFFIWRWLVRRTFRYKICVFGLVGGLPRRRWIDTAKAVPVGRAGDKLFYFKKARRWMPPPTIQVGANEFWYWEREDGELINIGLQDLDAVHRRMNVKFVDTDMRMQRLGIEKNLEFRHVKQKFWDKYGMMIMNVVAYVMMAMMIIVLFIQWRKTGAVLEGIGASVERMAERVASMQTGVPPEPVDKGEGSGLIPAIIIGILTTKYRIWRLKRGIFD